MNRPVLAPVVFFFALVFGARAESVGVFSQHADIGDCAKAGSATFDAATGEYRISGGGANMWGAADALHFVWKEFTGDFRFSADVRILGDGGNKHRKACLLVRPTSAPDAPYADVCLHGDGLAALQWREAAGARTFTIHSNLNAPRRLCLERRGNYFSMWLAGADGELKPAGGYLPVALPATVQLGLGVCAHDNKAIETAVFSNVKIEPLAPAPAAARPVIESTLETIAIASTDRDIIYRTPDRIEAPNWSRDGAFFLFNSKGRILRLPVKGGTPELLDTGLAVKCNNDHGLSPDGTQLAISDNTEGGKSRVYVLPVTGGTPRLLTPLAPSYWHGWSPDGTTLVYCAERGGNFDIYAMSAAGGAETRLTTAPGLDDGPEFSPDGKFIYFNSERSGTMQIWRMKPDGTAVEQVTADNYNNWFAHPSPDGKWIVFVSFGLDVKANQHPANKDVLLRLMPVGGGEIRTLTRLFGGQGTINVPSWSPDSKKVAFVSYQVVTP